MTETDFISLGLTWKPWIGNEYKTGGVFTKKILILGESHYGTKEDSWFLDEELTRLTIQEKIGEAPNDSYFHKKAFHTNIFKAFNDLNPTNENLIKFWHSVSYFNYVQGSVGEKARIRPEKEDWENSFESVHSSLLVLKPDVIVVLGYTLWKNIWKRFDFDIYDKTEFNNNHNVHRLKHYNNPLMFCIKHPSAGFSSNHFRPHILKYISEDKSKV